MRLAAGASLLFALLLLLLFAPTLLRGGLLAPHDALHISLPAFLTPRTAWTPLLLGGYPLLADPQAQGLYPVAALFPRTPSGFNAFVLSGYVLAASLAYALAFTLTRSVTASLVAGMTYGGSGFLMGHMMHTSMVHAAAWLPLVICSAELLCRGASTARVALAALAVALAALAGHPQPLLGTLYLETLYVAVLAPGSAGAAAATGAWLAALALGAASAGALLVPALELAAASTRAATGAELFATWALAPRHLLALIVPFAFGEPAHSLEASGFSFTEHAGYVGLLPAGLALVALGTGSRRRDALFWTAVAIAAALLALGAATPAGRLAPHLPGLAYFRSPGRHLMELAMAASVLASLGIAALERMTRPEAMRASRRAGAAILVMTGIAVAVVAAGSVPPARGALATGATALLLALASATALHRWCLSPRPASAAALLAVLAVDLGHVAAAASLQGQRVQASALVLPSSLRETVAELAASGQRLMPLRGAAQPAEAAPPNRSLLWGIRSASGYTPLRPRRYAELMGHGVSGAAPPGALASSDRTLDLLSVRTLLVPRSMLEGAPEQVRHGIGWSAEGLDVVLGGCGEAGLESTVLPLPGVAAAGIALVTAMSCAASIPDGAEVLRVTLTGLDGRSEAHVLHAGTHTSEWAIDRADVRGVARHRRARLFQDRAGVDAGGRAFAGHDYLAIFPTSLGRVSSMELSHVAREGSITVSRVSLCARDGRCAAVSREPGLLQPPRWRRTRELPDTVVFENAQALPRAWLVSGAVVLGDAAAVAAIRSSRLPDGRPFDPRAHAIVEEPVALPDVRSSGGSASVFLDRGTELTVRTDARAPALLVLSDLHAAGWRASVDGVPARLVRANVAFRAVPVPAGAHEVRFSYHPASQRLGSGLSALGVAGIALLAAAGARSRGRRVSRGRSA